MLKSVHISKSETCLTYALKRIGLESNITDLSDLENSHFEFINYVEFDKKDLREGDLLLWTHKDEIISIPQEIDENGKILFKDVLVGRHIGVYESDGTVTDCTRRTMSNIITPIIRIRKLVDIKTKPKFILRDISQNLKSNSNFEEKYDRLKYLMNLSKNLPFIEWSSHDNKDMYKIRNPYTKNHEHKFVLCDTSFSMDSVIELAIKVIEEQKKYQDEGKSEKKLTFKEAMDRNQPGY